MNFKRYALLVPEQGKLKIKVRQGMLAEDIIECLDVETEWSPTGTDKLYFFPGCAVPRNKVRENFSVTIKPEYATAAFISEKGLEGNESMFNKEVYVPLPAKTAEEWFVDMYGYSAAETIKLKSILLNCEDRVLIPYKSSDRPNDCYANLWWGDSYCSNVALRDYAQRGSSPGKHDLISGYSAKNRKLSFYTISGEGLSKLNCKIYSQDAILSILNKGNVVIDENRYKDFVLMGQSNNSENIVLMMELIANADFEKSFVYLLALLKRFRSKIIKQTEIQHVNFRGLLNFFGLDERKYKGGRYTSDPITLEFVSESLRSNNQFTRENIQIITPLFTSREFKDNQYFTLGPVLKKDAEQYLDHINVVEDSHELDIPQHNC